MTLLELTTTTRVKENPLLPHQGSANDAYLTALIKGVSAGISQWLGYPSMYQEARTEEYDIPARWGRILYTRHAPISSIASIKSRSSITTAWANVTAIDSTYYAIEAGSHIAQRVYLELGTVYSGYGSLQVVYTAGFAADTATLISSYPDIAEAADKQVVEEFIRRHHQGQGTMSTDAGVDFSQAPLRMLPAVKERLAPYRYYRFSAVL